MEAVGQLTGGVAHDFNNLLTIIRGSVDLLQRPGLSEERRARYVAAISDTVDRATRLTGQLLAFARNNVVTRQMLLKHLYRRADDQPQPKIIDVFISKLRKKLRNASGGAEFIETIPQRGWILRDIEAAAA